MSEQHGQMLIALYDYNSIDAHELSLKKHEKLELIDNSGAWWKVRNSQNKEGYVPSNFCKVQKQNLFSSLRNTLGRRKSKHNSSDGANSIDKSSKSSLNNLNRDPADAMGINSSGNKIQDNNNVYNHSLKNSRSGSEQNRLNNDEANKIPSGLNNNHPRTNGSLQNKPQINQNNNSASFDALYGMNISWCVARYDYKAQQRDEMTIYKGQKIQVLEKSSDGWWHGQALDDRTGDVLEIGWFPSNYVTIDQGNGIPGTNKYMSTSNSLGRNSNGTVLTENGKMAGANSAMNVSDMSANMYKMSLNNNNNNNPPSYQAHQGPNLAYTPSQHINSPHDSSAQVLQRVLTLFPFKKIQEEELTFAANEILSVIEKPIDDPEWWRCRNNRGEIGLVPTNYIKVLPEQPKSPKMGHDPFSNRLDNNNGSYQHQHSNSIISNGAGSKFLLDNGTTGQNNGNNFPVMNQNNGMKNADGESLRLQYAFASKKPDLKNEPWYWGSISRADCESMLSNFGEIGDFVIRDSETHPGDLTVTMRAGNKNRNFKVRVSENAFLIGQKNFTSLANLIDHYTRYPIYKFESDKQFLKRPFRHPGYTTNTMIS